MNTNSVKTEIDTNMVQTLWVKYDTLITRQNQKLKIVVTIDAKKQFNYSIVVEDGYISK